MKNYLLAEEIKSILVEMTINDMLPMDMTQLDMQSVMSKALTNLQSTEQYKRVERLEKLREFICIEDDKELIEAYEILDAHEDKSDLIDWVDGVTVVERYQTVFTVKSLFETIE